MNIMKLYTLQQIFFNTEQFTELSLKYNNGGKRVLTLCPVGLGLCRGGRQVTLRGAQHLGYGWRVETRGVLGVSV